MLDCIEGDIYCAPQQLSSGAAVKGGAEISVMYSNVYYEQVLSAREEPTKGGARVCDAV